MFSILLNFEFKKISKFYKTKRLAKTVTTLLFVVIFMFVAAGIYLFFIEGFSYIKIIGQKFFRSAILLYLNQMFLLILSTIILFSAFIQCIFTLFRSKNDVWLMSTPGFHNIPNLIYLKTIFNSLWPFFVIFIPTTIAIQHSFNINFIGVLFILLSLLLLLIFIVTLTLLIIFFIGFIYYQIANFTKIFKINLKLLITFCIIFFIVLSANIWQRTINKDIIALFKADQIEGQATLEAIESLFYYLPTNYVAKEIYFWQTNNTNEALLNFFTFSLYTFILILAWLGMSYFYYPLWQKLQENNYHAGTESKTIKHRETFNFSGGQTSALFKKEYLSFVRNGKNALWFLFLLFIWLAQTGINIMLQFNIKKYVLDTESVLAIILTLQFVTIVYFVSAFALRFVFPSFSSEKRTLWIIAHAPINYKKLFFSKFIFFQILFIIIGITIGAMNLNFLSIPANIAMEIFMLFLLAIIFIITLSLSFGAIFPNFETDDPSIISTSLPGLGFIFISLAYSAIGGFIIYNSFSYNMTAYLSIYILLTIISIISLLIYSPKTLEHRDFI